MNFPIFSIIQKFHEFSNIPKVFAHFSKIPWFLLKFCIIAFFDCTFHSRLRYFQTFGWHIRIIFCSMYPFAQIIPLFKLFCYFLWLWQFFWWPWGLSWCTFALNTWHFWNNKEATNCEILQNCQINKKANGEKSGNPIFPHALGLEIAFLIFRIWIYENVWGICWNGEMVSFRATPPSAHTCDFIWVCRQTTLHGYFFAKFQNYF